MRLLHLDNIETGTKLAHSIYRSDGQLLLGKGTILNNKYIDRLRTLGYTYVYIEDGLIDDIRIEQAITNETRQQALKCIREVMDDVGQGAPIQVSSAKKAVADIVDELINNKEVILNLSDIRSFDEYTFNHSVNVTVISILIGISLYLTKDKLLDLGLGALLHDVGKNLITHEILNKPGKLTDEEYETIKRHTWYGFNIIKTNPEIKITSAHVALQHHERFDGSGYPRGLKGNDIHQFARICAIADVFDAMSHDRCYRKKLPINEVHNYLVKNSGSSFDPAILERFVQKIALYPKASRVLLNDGRSGFVIKQNYLSPEKPVIRLFWKDGKELSSPVELNLLEHPHLTIVKVLEN